MGCRNCPSAQKVLACGSPFEHINMCQTNATLPPTYTACVGTCKIDFLQGPFPCQVPWQRGREGQRSSTNWPSRLCPATWKRHNFRPRGPSLWLWTPSVYINLHLLQAPKRRKQQQIVVDSLSNQEEQLTHLLEQMEVN